MNQIWKKWVGALFFLALVANISSGCGMENNAGNANSASGSATQSDAQTGNRDEDGIHIETPATTYSRYYNGSCLYVTDWNSNIYQYSLEIDEAKKNCYKPGGHTGAIWVTDNWLYYCSASKYSETGEGFLWRIPLNKENGEEQLVVEEKEKLAPVKNWYDFLDVTDEYVAYMTNDNIFRLDLASKKTKNITNAITFYESADRPYLVTSACLNPLVNDHTTFCYDENGKMYRLDLQKGTCKKANKALLQDGVASRICSADEFLYFGTAKAEKGNITKYNVKTDTPETILKGEKIEQLLLQEEPWDYDEEFTEWIAYPAFVSNDRLYLCISLRWPDEEYDDICHYADLVISCQIADGSGLRYEKDISESMCTDTDKELVEDPDQSFVDQTGHVIDCMGDYAIVTTTAYEESDSFAWIFYNLKTGKKHKVSPGDNEQFYLYFIGETGYSEETD